jgi:formylglycine-generating enzyme required for sulfatase activity
MTSFKSNNNPYTPNPFPAEWSSDWGQDKLGLWMAFTYKNVRQVFRWIRPNTFLMGSPESEQERLSSETQHQVTLTKGYWLAETACTQALWQVVMVDNPARFNDDDNKPVEQVSWDDAQLFIKTINGLIPELNACLPSEAQWEYACRAGTQPPFSFGENITPEQVNYDGGYPYLKGEKGLYRKKTVTVKSLAVNPWGLYEMHGNVWEWCQDWYGVYPEDPVIDPIGAMNGDYRVLRGGSWINYGKLVRSAYRSRGGPSYRFDYFGFRLALGQIAGIQPEKASKEELE